MFRRVLAALAFAFVLIAASPLASAQTVVPVDTVVSETVSINSNEWRAYTMSLSSSDTVRILITVTLGGAIDVYATSASGYADYVDPTSTQFDYYPSGSGQNVPSLSRTFDPDTAGTYYIVVDNAPVSTTGAPGSSPVTVQVVLEKSTFPWLLVGGIFFALAVVLIIVIVFLVRVNRRKKMEMMQPAAPVQGPWPGVPPGEPPVQPPSEPPQPPSAP